MTKLILILSLLCGGFVYGFIFSKTINKDDRILIQNGTEFASVVKKLPSEIKGKNNSLYQDFIIFYSKVWIKVLRKGKYFSGEYRLHEGENINDVLRKITNSHRKVEDLVYHAVTIPEGMMTSEIGELLRNKKFLIGLVPQFPEGSIMPNTYHVESDTKRTEILLRANKKMSDFLELEWQNRDQTIPIKTPQEALIVASIIEKEYKKDEHLGKIASVIYNRLKKNMRLQMDSTVIYAAKKLGLEMDKFEDIVKIDSLFNTYKNKGLPATPICNPGEKTIMAALHPEKNDNLFFLIDKNAGTYFSNHYSQHLVAVSHYKKTNNIGKNGKIKVTNSSSIIGRKNSTNNVKNIKNSKKDKDIFNKSSIIKKHTDDSNQ